MPLCCPIYIEFFLGKGGLEIIGVEDCDINVDIFRDLSGERNNK